MEIMVNGAESSDRITQGVHVVGILLPPTLTIVEAVIVIRIVNVEFVGIDPDNRSCTMNPVSTVSNDRDN